MKKLFLFILTCFISLSANAQVYRNLDMGGDHMTIRTKRTDSDLQGSAYLSDDWQKAIIQFSPGIEPATAEVKYDLLEDVLLLKGPDGNEYQFNDQPKQFLLMGSKELYKNGFPPVDKFTSKTFYNVIYDGKVKFLKKVSKSIIESKGYNSASVSKKIEQETGFYLIKADNKPIKVKTNEKSIVSALGNPELILYIKQNKLNLKSNDGIIALLKYYDTLNN